MGRFLGKTKRSWAPPPVPFLTKEKLFRPEESIVSFLAAGSDTEERIHELLSQQFPHDPEKVLRIEEQIKIAREKRKNK